MSTDPGRPRSASVLVATAAFVVVVAGMKAAAPILVPFLLSVFIAVIAAPAIFWLQRHRLPMGLALVVVITGILLVGSLVLMLMGGALHDFTRTFPTYQARLEQEVSAIIDWLGRMGVVVSGEVLREYMDPGAAMRMVAKVLGGLGNVLTNGFLILLSVVFILLEASGMPAKIQASAGGSGWSLEPFRRFLDTLKQYMAIKTWVSLVTGGTIYVWLSVLGVDYAVLWAVLAFFLNFVPNLGSIIAAVPAVLLAFLQLGAVSALLTALGYVAVNVVLGSIIEPRYMGRGLGLSTLVVFLSLVFWGWVLGPVGMLLSVPLTMTVKIALESGSDTRWMAILLGPGLPATEEPAPASSGQD